MWTDDRRLGEKDIWTETKGNNAEWGKKYNNDTMHIFKMNLILKFKNIILFLIFKLK